LARDYPERCLWASNWPHLNINPCPGDKDLLDWALHCLETEAVKRKVLVDNPAEVYGFPAA
jgi:D-galactarolactone isomerase